MEASECWDCEFGRAEHHEAGPPPAVQGVLRHGFLLGGAAAEGQHDLEALALVEGFLLADADHGAGVGAVGATAERDLVHDGGAVDQPADGTNVGPGESRVVEDGTVFGAAGEELVDEFLAGDVQGFGGGVEVEAVAGFVLHFGEQGGLAAEAGGAGDPVALGQHADDFGVGVLADLADQGAAIGGGHPVVGFDAVFGVDAGLEAGEGSGVLGAGGGFARVEGLGVHGGGYIGCGAPG